MPAVPTITPFDVQSGYQRLGAIGADAATNAGKSLDTYLKMEELAKDKAERKKMRQEILNKYSLPDNALSKTPSADDLGKMAFRLEMMDKLSDEMESKGLTGRFPRQKLYLAAAADDKLFDDAVTAINEAIKTNDTVDAPAAEAAEGIRKASAPVDVYAGEAPVVPTPPDSGVGGEPVIAPSITSGGGIDELMDSTGLPTKLSAPKTREEFNQRLVASDTNIDKAGSATLKTAQDQFPSENDIASRAMKEKDFELRKKSALAKIKNYGDKLASEAKDQRMREIAIQFGMLAKNGEIQLNREKMPDMADAMDAEAAGLLSEVNKMSPKDAALNKSKAAKLQQTAEATRDAYKDMQDNAEYLQEFTANASKVLEGKIPQMKPKNNPKVKSKELADAEAWLRANPNHPRAAEARLTIQKLKSK